MKIGFATSWIIMFSLFAANVPPAGASDPKPLVGANTAFALEMYGQLRSTSGNLVFSPYSISSALAMVYAGARGETARQTAQTLHFDQCTSDVHGLFKQLDTALAAAPGSNELEIANSLWPQQGYPFRNEYLDLLKNDYGATPLPLDYEHDADTAQKVINQWVDEKTRHKISQIIGPGDLDATTRLVLVNAIYFNGKWASPFPESATRPDNFHVSPDKTITTPFMNRHGDFKYGENDQLQLLSLPYAGGQLELTILLPRNPDGIGDLETSLTTASLAAWTASLRNQEVNVTLPKFKMATGMKLSKMLRDLGMKDAFDVRQADLSGMDGNPHWLYLSAVLHKAYIDVNEKGTEAAAATAVTVRPMGIMIRPRPREFRADHPFLFLLRDSTTGTILFLGRVTTPGSTAPDNF